MIDVRIVRELTVTGSHSPDGGRARSHLSAASGLVRLGQHLYVVADDEHWLGVFDLADEGPGKLLAIFDGELPTRHRARKSAKSIDESRRLFEQCELVRREGSPGASPRQPMDGCFRTPN
jgi:hypothetical protein